MFCLAVLRRHTFERGGKRSRAEFFVLSCGRAAVPGTNVLANVAAEHVAAYGLAQLAGNRAAQLDGEIGDATARIHDVGFYKSLRGTRVDTAAAGSAQIWRRENAILQSWGEIQGGEDRAEIGRGHV